MYLQKKKHFIPNKRKEYIVPKIKTTLSRDEKLE